MDRILSNRLVVAPPNSLAIKRHNLTLCYSKYGFDPAAKSGLKRFSIQPGKDATKRIM